MTKDDIIRMAVKCQLLTAANREGVYAEALERFASLVSAAEREECAKLCDSRNVGDHNREDAEARRCAATIRERSTK